MKSEKFFILEDKRISVYNRTMKFYGELLIFILLFITNARVLFLKRAKRDPLVALAPLTFILSILFIFAWGLDFFTVLAVIIAFLVLLSNFHALFRYTERLYVDHYSPLMMIWSFLTMILSGAAIAGLIYFRPIETKSEKIGVNETNICMNGSFRSGFETAPFYSIPDVDVYQFNPEAETESPDKIILFIPDKRGDTYYYKPYLQQLAKQGYTVFSGDFFASDCKWMHSLEDTKFARRFFLTLHSLLNNQWFMLQREYYTYNISLEINAMDKFISEKYGSGCKYFLLSDVMGNTACDDFAKAHPEKITGTFCIDSIPEYKSAGYGFVAQVDPILAFILKVERDDNLKITHKIVFETVKQIKSATGDSN